MISRVGYMSIHRPDSHGGSLIVFARHNASISGLGTAIIKFVRTCTPVRLGDRSCICTVDLRNLFGSSNYSLFCNNMKCEHKFDDEASSKNS
jgi:hypothetical protein